jgi:hypothetical protein
MNEENTFAKQDSDQQELYKRYGIDDLHFTGRARVFFEARRRISERNITDEEEKYKVYQEVKQHYFEYKQKKEGM